MPGGAPVVAIVNTSPDTVDMLRVVLEGAGMVALSAMTFELRSGEIDFEAFVRQHQPQVIIYDIAPPYEANWRLFQHLRQLTAVRDCRFVLTTTNARHVKQYVAGEELYEVIGKPVDLDQIVQATRRALADGR